MKVDEHRGQTAAWTASTPGGSNSHDPRGEELIIKEARRRQRRRWLVVGAVVILIATGVLSGLYLSAGDRGNGGQGAVSRSEPSPRSRIGPVAPTSSASSVALPHNYRLSQLVTARGRLFIAGYVASQGNLAPHGYSQCALIPVSPRTLKIGKAVRAGCNNPAMTGRLVAPVNEMTGSYSMAHVSLAVLNPRTGVYKVGTPVMTYSPDSTSTPVFAYGGNWLWIYDVQTTAGPQLLQINAVNGQTVATISTSQLFDPLMVANDDGVWLANSFRGSPAPYVLYHAIPGGSQLTGVLLGPNLHAYWITASGSHVWLGAGSVPMVQTLWRFDGVEASIGLHTAISGLQPFGNVVGDQTDGLWTVVAKPPLVMSDIGQSTGQPLDVIRINPDTGSQQVVARGPTLPAIEEEVGLAKGESILYGGSFYVLQPSSQLSAGYTRLVKVTP